MPLRAEIPSLFPANSVDYALQFRLFHASSRENVMRPSGNFFTQRVLAMLIITAFTAACSKNDLAITSKNFESQIDLQQNLVLEFSRPLVADSLVGAWDTTRYIAFQPAVKGSFKWTSPTTLVFSPSTGFRASTA